MYILENWCILRKESASRGTRIRVTGAVFGNPGFASGQMITTATIAGYRLEDERVLITTLSGSQYLLGKPDVSEPFGMRRLLRYIDESNAGVSRDPTQTMATGFVPRYVDDTQDR